MELLQLRYFFETANTGSFAKVAEKYMVPASSVSITVRRLEKELGCQLFDRHSNRITLNDNGKRLQHSLANILGELDWITAELSSTSTPKVEIKILAKTFRASVIDAIIEYRKLYPNIKFITTFDNSKNDYENYDLIVSSDYLTLPEYDRFELCNKPLHLIAASGSQLCGRTLTIEQLRNEPFIISSSDSHIYKILCKSCKSSGFTPQIAMIVNDNGYYNRCVKSGIGIGLTRRSSVSDDSGLEILNVSDFNEWITYYAYFKKSVHFKHLQNFIDFIKCRNY